MVKSIRRLHIFLLVFFIIPHGFAQAPAAFKYQSVARDLVGAPIPNRSLVVKISIRSGSPSGPVEWQETHPVSTDPDGLFVVHVGMGTSTGNGTSTSFETIVWNTATHYIEIEVDAGSGYLNTGTSQLLTIPYAFYSRQAKTADFLSLDDLADVVDTIKLKKAYILKWDGHHWLPQKDNSSDTVKYALKAGHAHVVDSARFAKQIIGLSDTANFSFYADSAGFATDAAQSNLAHQSVHTDTATYAKSFLPFNWIISGNTIGTTKFFGTINNASLVFKTSALERMSIDTMGRWKAGTTAASAASTLFAGNEGFLFSGTWGTGAIADTSNNTRLMWYPKKAAFRAGQVTSNRWFDAVIGDYSTGLGYSPQASGIYSVAMGINSTALDENCVSIGRHCSTKIVGVVINGGVIAIGDSCVVASTRSLAMGYKNRSDGGIVMGYKNSVFWASQTSVWGTNNFSSGDCAISLGSNTTQNGKGSFIFSDTSSAKLITNNDYRFTVRASGGTVFYSDAALTVGVELFPGAGSWSSVSDRRKKENLVIEDPLDILDKIRKLKISSWNYKSQAETIRHIGPMSKQFYSLFKVGENDALINTLDMDGITLLGIKALEKQTRTLSSKMESLQDLKSEAAHIRHFEDLSERLDRLEEYLKTDEK